MSFYTFCERVGSRIYHRYIGDDGRRYQEIVSETPLKLFIKNQGSEAIHRSLYGDKLSSVEFDSIGDMADFVKKYEGVMDIYGQTNPVYQFLSNKYKGTLEYDFKKFRILNFDIETRFDGCEDEDEVTVRRVFSDTSEVMTAAEMRKLSDVWEVWDDVNEKWYPVSKCPQQNKGGFPAAKDADYEVLTISCKIFGSDKRVTFGLKDYEVKNPNQIYTKCADEADLLTRFIQFVRFVDPDILTGWNIEWFDIPYIINRVTKVLGEEMAMKMSPFHAHTKKCLSKYGDKEDPDAVGYRILGVTVYDYYDLYKTYNPTKQESYKLDSIAEIELGENKVDFSEYDNNLMKLYKMNFQKYIDYNEQDVYLVERLDDKKQFIRLAITTVLMTKSQYRDVHGKVKLWDNLIYNMLNDDGVVLPPAPRARPKEKIIGAYVKDPIPAKYRWVVSVDLTSLYPSICMMFNMSPETIVREEQGTLELVEALLKGVDLAAPARERGYCMAANGSAYRQDEQGVLPRAMKYVFDTRKKYKSLMLDVKKEKEAYLKAGGKEGTPEYRDFDNRIAMLDATQGAMKVLANSGYGVTANVAFRYFSKSIAQGITLTGQLVIQYIGNRINEYLNERFKTNKDYVITSDTDSCYLTLDGIPTNPLNKAESVEELHQFMEKELQPFIDQCFKELSDKLGCKKNLLDMKREAISDVAIWRAAKNYVCQVYDMEGVRYAEPQLKMMGIETARSDKPKIVRKRLEEDLKILLNGTEKQLHKCIEEFKKEFYNTPVEELAKPMGVSEVSSWMNPDGTPKEKTPWNTKAALIYNLLIREKGLDKKYERIRNGNKIKIFTLKKINPIQNNYIAFLTELPKELGIHEYLDYDSQWEKVYISPLKSFTDILGWSTKKINTLEDLFG